MLRSPFRLDFYNHQPDVGNALYFLIFRFLYSFNKSAIILVVVMTCGARLIALKP
jgi:hypothetical protein